MSTEICEPTLKDHLKEAEAAPLHDLHERASHFLHDHENPNRLYLGHSLGTASVGQEIEGEHYRLTEGYTKLYDSGFHSSIWISGLVAVERVPDEAVVERGDERRADDYAEAERLWRLRPARVMYAGMGFDDVFPATIEDLSKTGLELRNARRGTGWNDSGPQLPEYDLPYRNFANELEGEELEHAQSVTSQLLDMLEAK